MGMRPNAFSDELSAQIEAARPLVEAKLKVSSINNTQLVEHLIRVALASYIGASAIAEHEAEQRAKLGVDKAYDEHCSCETE
jgi:hypothetical protein